MNNMQYVSTLMPHVNDVRWDLKAINQVQSNEVVVHRILNRLPRRFDKFVSQLQSEKTIPTF